MIFFDKLDAAAPGIADYITTNDIVPVLILIIVVILTAAVTAKLIKKKKAAGPFDVPDGFTLTAHSGAMGLADNSVEAMEAGVAAGAEIVEFDLNYSPSGRPVLSHDRPKDENAAPIDDAFAFLRDHPGVKANVDVKSTLFLEKIPPLAESFGVTDRIFFTGLFEKDIPAAREKAPGIPYYINTEIKRSDDLDALADKVASLGALGVNINKGYLTHRLVKTFREKGLLVSVWTVNNRGDAAKALSLGPDNVTSRKPDMIASMIKR